MSTRPSKHKDYPNKVTNSKKRPHCVLEFCPTSYEKLGSWKGSMKNLIQTLWDRRFHITLGSDDPGPMKTNIWTEYQRIHKEFNMKLWQTSYIADASIEHSFAPDDIKERLLLKTHAQKHGLKARWDANEAAKKSMHKLPFGPL